MVELKCTNQFYLQRRRASYKATRMYKSKKSYADKGKQEYY
jgi:hypothetical protein